MNIKIHDVFTGSQCIINTYKYMAMVELQDVMRERLSVGFLITSILKQAEIPFRGGKGAKANS